MTGISVFGSTWSLVRILRWVGVVIFVAAGSLKLVGLPVMVEMFDTIGFGQWFRYVVGVFELTGAALLLGPRTTPLAALGLSGLMLGAVFVDAIVLRRPPILSALTLIMMAVLAWESGHTGQ